MIAAPAPRILDDDVEWPAHPFRVAGLRCPILPGPKQAVPAPDWA